MTEVGPPCPLCGFDPNDPTLHAPDCLTVVGDLCGVVDDHNALMCVRPDHVPNVKSTRSVAWQRWREEHEWVPLADVWTRVLPPAE